MAAVLVTESDLAGSFKRIGEDASDKDLLAKCEERDTGNSRSFLLQKMEIRRRPDPFSPFWVPAPRVL